MIIEDQYGIRQVFLSLAAISRLPRDIRSISGPCKFTNMDDDTLTGIRVMWISAAQGKRKGFFTFDGKYVSEDI